MAPHLKELLVSKNRLTEDKKYRICKRNHQYDREKRQCPICQKQRDKEYNQMPERKAYYRMKQFRRYWPNLSTLEAWNQRQLLFEQQKGCCALCKKPQSEDRRSLAVDHDKYTGKVRGLLCYDCNRYIIRDHTEERLVAMLKYIRKTG